MNPQNEIPTEEECFRVAMDSSAFLGVQQGRMAAYSVRALMVKGLEALKRRVEIAEFQRTTERQASEEKINELEANLFLDEGILANLTKDRDNWRTWQGEWKQRAEKAEANVMLLNEDYNKANEGLQKFLDLCHDLGWNGVENSKLSWVFLSNYLAELHVEIGKEKTRSARLQSELYDCNNALTEALSKLPVPTLRQEFEEWATGDGIEMPLVRNSDGEYAHFATHSAWLAYQARAGKETKA